MEEIQQFDASGELFPELIEILRNADGGELDLFRELVNDISSLNVDEVMQSSARKYEVLLKITFIGELVINVAPEDRDDFKLLRITRNIAADYFHFSPDSTIKEFLQRFVDIFKKREKNVAFFEEKNTELNKKNEGSFLFKHFKDEEVGRIRVKNFYCQMGYFLLKSKTLFEQGNYYSAAMAIIGAGNCAKAFNRSLPKPKRKDRGKGPGVRSSEFKSQFTEDLFAVRGNYAHPVELMALKSKLEEDYRKMDEKLREMVESARSKGLVDFNMRDVEEYSRNRMEKEENVPEKVESPRLRL